MRTQLLIPAVALVLAALPATASADDVSVVIDADFSVFTEGSPAKPVDIPSYGTGSFTSYFANWRASKVAQAGGKLLIRDGGYVQTASSNLSANGGIMRVTARVKMTDDYGGMFKISCGYSSANARTLIVSDTAWHDLSVVIGGGTAAVGVRIEPQLSAGGVLVQSLKVEQSPAFISAPEAYQPNQADGESFTARWRSVSTATAYILNVYSYNGTEKVYKLKDENVGKVNQYKVTGLDPATTYYYTVSATNGTGVSDPSEEIKVIKVIYHLDKPTGLSVQTGNADISAHWNAVTDAQEYILTVNKIITCSEDRSVEVISENFDKVTKGELDAINFIINPDLDPYTQTTGWTGDNLGTARGHMVLTPFSGDTAWLSTPTLDLKGKTGEFTVKANLAVGAFGTMYTGSADALLINAAGDTLETKAIELGQGFTDYNLTFSQGASDCRVVLRYTGDKKLFVNSMSIDQLKAKGQKVVCFLGETVTTSTSARASYTREKDAQLSCTVTAAAETVRAGDIEMLYSDPSDAVVVDFGTGLAEGVTADNAVISVSGREISISVIQGCRAELYDMTGRNLGAFSLQAGTTVLSVPADGVVLLRLDGRTYKLLLK